MRRKTQTAPSVLALLLLPFFTSISALVLDGFTDDLFKADATPILRFTAIA